MFDFNCLLKLPDGSSFPRGPVGTAAIYERGPVVEYSQGPLQLTVTVQIVRRNVTEIMLCAWMYRIKVIIFLINNIDQDE